MSFSLSLIFTTCSDRRWWYLQKHLLVEVPFTFSFWWNCELNNVNHELKAISASNYHLWHFVHFFNPILLFFHKLHSSQQFLQPPTGFSFSSEMGLCLCRIHRLPNVLLLPFGWFSFWEQREHKPPLFPILHTVTHAILCIKRAFCP